MALSLILAMLLFKPAPIYILDEVDAALDLSHTQNIGQMLRSHFRHSQVCNAYTFMTCALNSLDMECSNIIKQSQMKLLLAHNQPKMSVFCVYIW